MKSYIIDQNNFLKNVALLITKAHELGFMVTAGEMERPREIQLVYFHGKRIIEQEGTIKLVDSPRRSKTMNSKHLVRRALDLNFFKDGIYINGLTKNGKTDKSTIKEYLQPLGDYWESLDPRNKWGGNFNSIFDAPHFEQK